MVVNSVTIPAVLKTFFGLRTRLYNGFGKILKTEVTSLLTELLNSGETPSLPRPISPVFWQVTQGLGHTEKVSRRPDSLVPLCYETCRPENLCRPSTVGEPVKGALQMNLGVHDYTTTSKDEGT